eukprot:11959646-Karenia_brevis.AAC.1
MPSVLSPRIRRPLPSEAQFHVIENGWPQRAFDACAFYLTRPPLAQALVCMTSVFAQELFVLLDKVH